MERRLTTPDLSIDQLRALYRFMSNQWFVAGRSELIDLGFRASTISSWCRRGRLVPLLQAVYSYGRDIESRESAWKAALIFGGRGSALTGISACEFWGMVQLRDRIPHQIHVARASHKAITRHGRSPALAGTKLSFCHRRLLVGDVRSRQGIELVRPSLALIDLAESHSEREVRFAFLEACRLQHFGRDEVEFCFRRAVRRRGAKKINALLAAWVPELARIRSVLEGLFLLAWAASGYPMPEVNVKVAGFEVDMYWPQHELVLELDGNSFHSDPISRARDRAKAEHLGRSGRTVLRATFQQVDSRPAETVAMVIREIETRCRF